MFARSRERVREALHFLHFCTFLLVGDIRYSCLNHFGGVTYLHLSHRVIRNASVSCAETSKKIQTIIFYRILFLLCDKNRSTFSNNPSTRRSAFLLLLGVWSMAFPNSFEFAVTWMNFS
jgi:hypothetical protein